MTKKPSKNILYGYNKNLNFFINLYKKKILPNKIIFSGPKGIGKSTFAKTLVNLIISGDQLIEYNDQNLINYDNNYLDKFLQQNFFLIDVLESKKIIDIEQIRNLIVYSQKQALNNTPRFIVIDNVEKLNKNSANALLKLLEEPFENMNFMLIHDNKHKLFETINSRCIKFNMFFTHNQTIEIVNKLLNINIKEHFDTSFINNYYSIGDLINLYNFSLTNDIDLNKTSLKELVNFLITEKKYLKDQNILSLCIKLIETMFYNNFLKSKDIKFYKLYKYFADKFFSTNKYNLDLETLFIEIKASSINE